MPKLKHEDCGHAAILNRVRGARSWRQLADDMGLAHMTVYGWFKRGYVPPQRRELCARVSTDRRVKPGSFRERWEVNHD